MKSSTGKYYLILSTVFILHASPLSSQPMTREIKSDIESLSKLNAKFIQNYITQDTASHNQIIHKDFICIEGSGKIVERKEYMDDWVTSYGKSNFTSFKYSEEKIRVFGNTALVRSKTIWSRIRDGVLTNGSSVYTDTYFIENGRWWCVQAQITPIK